MSGIAEEELVVLRSRRPLAASASRRTSVFVSGSRSLRERIGSSGSTRCENTFSSIAVSKSFDLMAP